MKIRLLVFFLLCMSWQGYARRPSSPIPDQLGDGLLSFVNHQFNEQAVVLLRGGWDFYANEFVGCGKQPTTEQVPVVPLPTLRNQSPEVPVNNYRRGTYRLQVVLPHKMLQDHKVWAVHVKDLRGTYKLYVNGKLIIHDGEFAEGEQQCIPGQLPQTGYFNAISDTLNVTVQVCYSEWSEVDKRNPIELGPAPQMLLRRNYAVMIDIALASSMLLIFFYHISLFLFRRKELAFLYFSITSLLVSFQVLLNGEEQFLVQYAHLDAVLGSRLALLSFSIIVLLAVGFVHELFPEYYGKRILRGIQLISLFFALIGLSIAPHLQSVFQKWFELFALAVIFHTMYIFLKISIKGSLTASLLLLGTLAMCIAAVNDVLLMNWIANDLKLMPIGVFLAVSSQGLVLARRFSVSLNKAEELGEQLNELNRTLEKKVEKKTNHLKIANKQLEYMNEEMALQKLSIEKHLEHLNKVNQELELLSIVARKTENAVIIMDASGNFIWVNESFTRIFGFTVTELIRERGQNIVGLNTPPWIKKLIADCVSNKITITYEQAVLSRSLEKLWVQVSLTPILDVRGNIEKLIAVDTDITKLKTAHSLIDNQKEELQRQMEVVTRQRDEIRLQQNEIMDSIVYAKRIQMAVLPSEQVLEDHFKGYFILYKPKDVVSGDFYWIAQRNQRTYVAVGDCTGHGVPGAFMSLLGITFLNEIINWQEQLDADHQIQANEILNKLRDKIKSSLKQTGQYMEANDGIDAALCIIDMEKNTLQYSGAFNPLYLVRNEELQHYKADKMPIGIFYRESKSFTNHVLEYQTGDAIYIFTDGYTDQFGGPKGRKFYAKRMRELILSISGRPMSQQMEILDNENNAWRGDGEQVDDILVLGLRL